MDLFSSAFDFTAVDFLGEMGVPAHKGGVIWSWWIFRSHPENGAHREAADYVDRNGVSGGEIEEALPERLVREVRRRLPC